MSLWTFWQVAAAQTPRADAEIKAPPFINGMVLSKYIRRLERRGYCVASSMKLGKSHYLGFPKKQHSVNVQIKKKLSIAR